MIVRRSWLFGGLVSILGLATACAADAPTGPAYIIVLRSRHADVVPNRTRDAQTGGGSILVEQPDSNTIAFTMGGSAVAGSDFRGSSAGLTFDLSQELDIVATRAGARPPRVGMVGRLMGTLQVTEPGCCCKSCGSASQGPGTACLTTGGASILSVNVKSSDASCGQESSVNHRDGPIESAAAAGSYCLTGSFRICVNQGKGVFHRQSAVADFDPAPQLDAFWADALKPFRAVPRRDFGFKVVLRVVEDAAAADASK